MRRFLVLLGAAIVALLGSMAAAAAVAALAASAMVDNGPMLGLVIVAQSALFTVLLSFVASLWPGTTRALATAAVVAGMGAGYVVGEGIAAPQDVVEQIVKLVALVGAAGAVPITWFLFRKALAWAVRGAGPSAPPASPST